LRNIIDVRGAGEPMNPPPLVNYTIERITTRPLVCAGVVS